MKKGFAVILACLMMLALVTGCGGNSDSSRPPEGNTDTSSTKEPAFGEYTDYYKGKNVSMIIPWAAGGGADLCGRLLIPYLEEELGCTITVENITGGGGYIGWEEFLNRSADGMTISQINNTATLTGYLNPANERDYINLDSYVWIANAVIDPMVVNINPKETRFTNFEELVEYAKTTPTTYGTSGVGSAASVAMYKLNDALGTQFVEVPATGWSETVSALMGGHIDVAGCSVADCHSQVTDGTVNIVAILDANRSAFYPDVRTVGEITGTEILANSSRGFGVAAGTPQEIIDIWAAAYEKAINSDGYRQDMEELNFAVAYLAGDDYYDYISGEEAALKELAPAFGWE